MNHKLIDALKKTYSWLQQLIAICNPMGDGTDMAQTFSMSSINKNNINAYTNLVYNRPNNMSTFM